MNVEIISSEEDQLVVHFNLHTKTSSDASIGASDVYIALANEVVRGRFSHHLAGIIIDQESIEIIGWSIHISFPFSKVMVVVCIY